MSHHGIHTSTVVEVGAGLLIGAAISERQRETGESYGRAMLGVGGEMARAAAMLVVLFAALCVVAVAVQNGIWGLLIVSPLLFFGLVAAFYARHDASVRNDRASFATASAVAPVPAPLPTPEPFTSRIPRYPTRDSFAPRR